MDSNAVTGNDYIAYQQAHRRPRPSKQEVALFLIPGPRNDNAKKKLVKNIKAWKSKSTYGQKISKAGVKNQFGSVFDNLSTEDIRQLRRALLQKPSTTTPRAQAERDVSNALKKMMPKK